MADTATPADNVTPKEMKTYLELRVRLKERRQELKNILSKQDLSPEEEENYAKQLHSASENIVKLEEQINKSLGIP